MSLKSRLRKVEGALSIKDRERDPHGKRTPFRMKAVELWQRGEYGKLKEHCKDNPEFYELLVSYSKVIEKVAIRNVENKYRYKS